MSKEKISIKLLFEEKQATLKSKLGIPTGHTVTKGDHCEEEWIAFLRSFLPDKYAVDKGFVFDSKGDTSEQIDVIIYDALYTPLIYETATGEKYITAESVYAVFESKSKIGKSTLEYANKKIESVKKLHRTSRGMINAGRFVSPRELTHIIGGILAIDSAGNSTVKKHVENYPYIDIGCAINETSFIVSRSKEGNVSDVMFSSKDELILSFFYMILDSLYKLGTVAGIDIRNYADITVDSIKIKREEC